MTQNYTERGSNEGKVLAMFSGSKYFSLPPEPIIHSKEKVVSIKEKTVSIWTNYHKITEIRNFGTIIISPLATKIMTNDDSVIEKEILGVLDDGGHVCILCDSGCHEDKVINDILLMFSTKLVALSNSIVEIKVRQSEFTGLLRDYGIVSNVFKSDVQADSVICTTRYVLQDENLQRELTKFEGEAIVGLTLRRGNGLLTLLPFHLQSGIRRNDLENAVVAVSKALLTHRKNLIVQPPGWISEIKLHDEELIFNRNQDLKSQIKANEALLHEQLDLKSVLWLKHKELQQKCREILSKIGVFTSENDTGEEDFWIVDESGSPKVICECKGKDHNLRRQDLSEFDEHREANGKTEDFPSLLIVNSFNVAKSPQEKDEPIPSNVIQKALRLNMLIIRTIDMIAVLNLVQKKKLHRQRSCLISHLELVG